MKTVFRDVLQTSMQRRFQLFWFGCIPVRLFLAGLVGGIGSVRPVEVACITLVAGTVAIGWNFARYRDGVNLVWWDARTEIFVGFLLFVWSIGVIGGGWAGWVLGLPLLLDVMIGGFMAWGLDPWAHTPRHPKLNKVQIDHPDGAALLPPDGLVSDEDAVFEI